VPKQRTTLSASAARVRGYSGEARPDLVIYRLSPPLPPSVVPVPVPVVAVVPPVVPVLAAVVPLVPVLAVVPLVPVLAVLVPRLSLLSRWT
jgi:hypothetical protein